MNWKLLFLAFLMPCVATAAPLTSKQGDLILQELRQIRQMLEFQQARPAIPAFAPPSQLFEPKQGHPSAAPAPRNSEQSTKLNVKGAPTQGRTDVPVTLVMYTDYECPFCRRFETQTLPEIRKQFIVPGKLKLVIMDAPLDIHPNARKAAESTRCAADQNLFWEFRDKLSLRNESLDITRLKSYANEVGLDSARFDECMTGGKYAKTIADAVVEAGRQGVGGTPSFIVGIENNGIVEGVRIMGAQPYAVFEQKLNEFLKKSN